MTSQADNEMHDAYTEVVSEGGFAAFKAIRAHSSFFLSRSRASATLVAINMQQVQEIEFEWDTDTCKKLTGAVVRLAPNGNARTLAAEDAAALFLRLYSDGQGPDYRPSLEDALHAARDLDMI